MKFNLSCVTNERDWPETRKVEMSFEAEYIDDILSTFRDFLLGCGYKIQGDIIEGEKDSYWDDSNVQEGVHDGFFSMENIPNNNWLHGNKNPHLNASEK